MNPLRLYALGQRLDRRDAEALGRTALAMPRQRVCAREKVAAKTAKGDFERMRLHEVAVPLENPPNC
jgi:hypothetical protein